jgi:DNA-binding NarL/FixJ family response regulator
VLIVDDNPLIRSGLRRMLQFGEDWQVCGEADGGSSALRLAENHRPDIVLMDLSMPGMDGLEATQRIKAKFPGTKILLLTAHVSRGLAEIAFRAGVNGYVVKASTRQELFRAMKAIKQGEIYVSPAISPAESQDLVAEDELK